VASGGSFRFQFQSALRRQMTEKVYVK